jgi:N-methylhydantoinase A/oxoprolinase/acetone carboxylase beta subunit
MGDAEARFSRELDLRYTGQGYELRTPVGSPAGGRLTTALLAATRSRFDERHAQIHGHAASDRPVEVVSYRVRVRVTVPKYVPRPEPTPAAAVSTSAAIKGRRRVHFDAGTSVDATVYERDGLGVESRVQGPAIIEQFDATTAVPLGWSARVDQLRNLILER